MYVWGCLFTKVVLLVRREYYGEFKLLIRLQYRLDWSQQKYRRAFVSHLVLYRVLLLQNINVILRSATFTRRCITSADVSEYNI